MAGVFDLRTMYKQAGGPVTVSSVLLNMDQLKPETVDAIRNSALIAAVNKAYELWGRGQSLTIRDLNATDMGYTNNVFTDETNATANQWNEMATGAFTVPTATVIAIYGIAIGYELNGSDTEMPLTGIRIDVGGSRHAQWHLQALDILSSGAVTAPVIARPGITRSPIIVGEDITVTMYEYTRTTGMEFDPCWLGVTVEKQGVTLKP